MAYRGSSNDPDYIVFLLSPDLEHDSYFTVGNKDLVKPVRIGAVKKMLMAHSDVLRRQLQESLLKEKGEVYVEDIYPDTFRNILRYVYGYDMTTTLNFYEADDMFYAADKYQLLHLKEKLAHRLIKLLTPENVCSLLNNPVCYTHLQLDSAITKILQYETERVLASPPFLQLCVGGFVKILQQEGLIVPEIELWRSALRWAKHKASSDDGEVLRQQMSDLAKHLKVCTLNSEQFLEVGASGVLRREEISFVCQSIRTGEKVEDLEEFCNDVVPRTVLEKPNMLVFGDHYIPSNSNHESTFTVHPKYHNIELLPWKCKAVARLGNTPARATYWVDECEIDIWQYKLTGERLESKIAHIEFSGQLEYGQDFEIPLTKEGRNIVLESGKKYKISLWFNGSGCEMYFSWNHKTSFYSNEHMLVTIRGNGRYPSPVKQLVYRVLEQDT